MKKVFLPILTLLVSFELLEVDDVDLETEVDEVDMFELEFKLLENEFLLLLSPTQPLTKITNDVNKIFLKFTLFTFITPR